MLAKFVLNDEPEEIKTAFDQLAATYLQLQKHYNKFGRVAVRIVLGIDGTLTTEVYTINTKHPMLVTYNQVKTNV